MNKNLLLKFKLSMKHTLRSKSTGRFVPRSTAPKIVNGRLYEYRGAVVRARRLCNNGLRYVSFHKTLNGFVRDEELVPIDTTRVRDYLARA
jgi:hypothetical protein